MREIRTSGSMSGRWIWSDGSNCGTSAVSESDRRQLLPATCGHRASGRLCPTPRRARARDSPLGKDIC